MIRLKQVNIESYRVQYKQKRGRAMSLYDVRLRKRSNNTRIKRVIKQKQFEKTFTKDKIKTWNKWRIQMKNKALIFTMLMLIMMMRIIVLIHPLDKAMFVIKRIHIVGCVVDAQIMNMLMVVRSWSFKM